MIAFLAVVGLVLGADTAQAQRGGHGGGHAGGGHAGGGHAGGGFAGGGRGGGFGGFGGAGGFRGGGLGFGGGLPLGYGAGAYRSYYGAYGHRGLVYRPYYGFGFFGSFDGYGISTGYGYGLDAYGAYAPYYGGLAFPAYPLAAYASALPAPIVASQPQNPADRPPPDDLAHLQLLVPENAEVVIDGMKTTQTGTTREFVSPALSPGTKYRYKITVRYTDAKGKQVEDAREIRFQANDWFSIDFPRPAPPQTAPVPMPLQKTGKDQ